MRAQAAIKSYIFYLLALLFWADWKLSFFLAKYIVKPGVASNRMHCDAASTHGVLLLLSN